MRTAPRPIATAHEIDGFRLRSTSLRRNRVCWSSDAGYVGVPATGSAFPCVEDADNRNPSPRQPRSSLVGAVRGRVLTKTGDTERRLIAIFAADVEGYSRLMGADEVRTLGDLTQRRDILDSLIASRRGRIANTAGDSVLAEFGSAVDAVQCAVEAQKALSQANVGLSPDRHINFRIGVHVGDVMIKGGDLFGDGVNIAARMQTLASAGGVCLSGVAFDQVRKILPFTFADLGAQQVKNIDEPVRAFSVVAERSAVVTASENASVPLALPDKPSIAGCRSQNMGILSRSILQTAMVERSLQRSRGSRRSLSSLVRVLRRQSRRCQTGWA